MAVIQSGGKLLYLGTTDDQSAAPEKVKPTKVDPFKRESDNYRHDKAEKALELRGQRIKWAKIELELGESTRNLQRWIDKYLG